jgi:hypothetical protein
MSESNQLIEHIFSYGKTEGNFMHGASESLRRLCDNYSYKEKKAELFLIIMPFSAVKSCMQREY